MTAPILRGYLCRVCGNETIQTPWDASDGFVCDPKKGCGATNIAPLLTTEKNAQSLRLLREAL
jgi:hypothetical protein